MNFLIKSLMTMLLVGGIAQAEPESPFALLLEKIQTEGANESAADSARLKEFQQKKSEQSALLAAAKKELLKQQKHAETLRGKYAANEKKISKLTQQQELAVGTLGEVFGVVRQVAGDLKSQLAMSMVSAQLKGRTNKLIALTNAKSLPSLPEIKELIFALQQEVMESGRIVTFTAPYVNADGKKVTGKITRVGSFNLLADNKYLNLLTTGTLVELSRQPAGRHMSAVDDYFSGQTSLSALPIDPSRGSILSLLVDAPTLLERIDQGGIVGYIILLLLAVGLIMGVERFAYLKVIASRIKKQLASEELILNNPLGRILSVYRKSHEDNLEGLELKLDEAIVRETPKLERGIKAVKLLAAIAPLLGLLGTVTGMIATFQSITMFGSGDPKLMAGGISQALVTTVLGLVAAIPLILLHGLIASRSKVLINVLDEQSVGILAEKAEQGAIG